MSVIAINRSTGNLYLYSPLHTYSTQDFLFDSIEDFQSCILEDENAHEDDYLLFNVDKIYKPDVNFVEITDGEIY